MAGKKGELEDGATLYVFDFGTESTLDWKLGVETATVAAKLCRTNNNKSDYAVCMNVLQQGIPFVSLCNHTKSAAKASSGDAICKPMRLAGYEFSKADYEAYFQETESLLAKEGVARRALKTGGIVWRLAVGESFSRVLEANWSHSHSSTIYVSGDGSEYFDEKCTVEEMDAICGVYLCPQVTKAEILEKSWWPTDKIWKKYAAYPYWSDFHEFWFRNRSEAIKNGQAQPLSQHDHKKMIRKNGKLNRMEKKIEENSLHFFDHINEGGLTYRV